MLTISIHDPPAVLPGLRLGIEIVDEQRVGRTADSYDEVIALSHHAKHVARHLRVELNGLHGKRFGIAVLNHGVATAVERQEVSIVTDASEKCIVACAAVKPVVARAAANAVSPGASKYDIRVL